MTYWVTSGPATISGSTVTITPELARWFWGQPGSDHELHHRHYQHQLHRGSSNADAGLHGHHRTDLRCLAVHGERKLSQQRSGDVLGDQWPGNDLRQHGHDHRSWHGGSGGQPGSDHELHHRHYQHQLHRGSSNATLAFTAITGQTYGVSPFTVSASLASSGAVTYSVTSGPATISGSTVTITGVGTVVLGASQAATTNYTTATTSTSFTVAPATPTRAAMSRRISTTRSTG